MAEELGERTEHPTGRRLSEARSRGQIAKSQDLATAVDLVGAVLLITLLGGGALGVMATMLRRILEDQTAGEALDVASIRPLAMWAGTQGLRVAGPGLLITFILGVLAHFVQVGWLFTTQPIQPN